MTHPAQQTIEEAAALLGQFRTKVRALPGFAQNAKETAVANAAVEVENGFHAIFSAFWAQAATWNSGIGVPAGQGGGDK